jgi:potassium-transporting ATPase potassium-binding subunit
VVFPMIGIAQSLSVKAKSPESVATFRTDTMLFGVLLFTIVIIVGGLTHFPALTLGPILEHFLLTLGISL